MEFIEHEQSQHVEFYVAIEQQLLNIDVERFPDANIKVLCVKIHKDISKHWSRLINLLAKIMQRSVEFSPRQED